MLSDLIKVVLAYAAQGVEKLGKRLLQSVPLGLGRFFHLGELGLGEPLPGEMLELLKGNEVADLVPDKFVARHRFASN